MRKTPRYAGKDCDPLHLRFRDTGQVYRYFDFPAADHVAFLHAESKGRHFRSRIRDHFRYERLAKLHAA